MKLKTFTYIEVENLENEWAVKLDRCKLEMKPAKLNFILVLNEINSDSIYCENMIKENKPEKTINNEYNFIADDFIEVGFWKIKKQIKL